MILSLIVPCAQLLFSLTAATGLLPVIPPENSYLTVSVLVPRPIAHVVEDIAVVPRGLEKKGASAVKNGTATPTRPSSSLITEPPQTGWPTYSRKWPVPGCTIPPGTLVSSEWCRV